MDKTNETNETNEKVAEKLKPMRFSKREISLIKNTFEDMDFLISIRNFLLQGELNETEKVAFKSLSENSEVFSVLKKAVISPLDKRANPNQSVDLFSSMEMQPVPVDHAVIVIAGKVLAKKYLDQRFEAMSGKTIENEIIFDDLVKVLPKTKKDEMYINFIARNFLLSHIDYQLFSRLMVIAGTPEETLEQQAKRLMQDSSK